MKKGLALFISIVMILGILNGCVKTNVKTDKESQTTKETETTTSVDQNLLEYLNYDNTYPIIKEGYDITIRFAARALNAEAYEPEKMWYWSYLEDRLNIKTQVEHIPWSSFNDRTTLMFGANDVPDIVFGGNLASNLQVKYGDQEGQLMAYNQYYDLMPNYMKWNKSYYDSRIDATTPAGNQYCLPRFSFIPPEAGANNYINKAWLDKLKIDPPKTISNLTDVLRAFKKVYPESVPFGGCYMSSVQTADSAQMLLRGLGFSFKVDQNIPGAYPAMRNGELTLPAYDDLYLEYLKIMKTWYTEELVDKDYFTIDRDTVQAQIAEEQVGITYVDPLIVYPATQEGSSTEWEKWEYLEPLTSEYNNKKISGPTRAKTAWQYYWFSGQTKYPEVVARIADWYYTDEVAVLWNGPQAGTPECLNYKDIGWTYEIKEDGKYFFSMVDGININKNLRPHQPSIGSSGTFENPNLTWNDIKLIKLGQKPLEKDTTSFYYITGADQSYKYSAEAYPGNIYLSAEENVILTDIESVLLSHITSETAKFITGARPLSEFEAFRSELKNMGVEKVLEIYKKHLDIYRSGK